MTTHLDTPMDYGSVAKKGSMLGTGGVILDSQREVHG